MKMQFMVVYFENNLQSVRRSMIECRRKDSCLEHLVNLIYANDQTKLS